MPYIQNVEFQNETGQTLAGRLHLPLSPFRGAAVLAVAPDTASVTGIATIGAPAEPGHVLHLVEQDIDTILSQGRAEVKIGGRPFEIGADFVQDLKHRLSTDHIKKLSHDLLILHAPHDAIVGIDNAAAIFTAAKHPKSFLSLLIRLIICSAKQKTASLPLT